MILSDLFHTLTTAHNWAGPEGFAARVGEHLLLTLAVVALAAAIALPLGIWIGHTRRGAGFVGALTGAGRAIPTLGLLTLLGLWLGIGLGAPLLALVVLAIPSLLAGAYSGVASVSTDHTDAATAIGFTPWQVITRVEIPLATGVILGGLRSTVLQVISTATLVAYVSDWGLGRYIFSGLALRDYTQMLAGSVLVVCLALLSEALLSALQRRATRRKANHHASR